MVHSYQNVAVEYFNNVVQKDPFEINMSIRLEPKTLAEYIEGWRRQIWDEGFGPILKGENAI